MISKERLYAVMAGQPCDRTAVTPIFMSSAAHDIGRTYRDLVLPLETRFVAAIHDAGAAAREGLRKGGSRFILMPGCEVPPGTPEANIRAFCLMTGS